MNNIEKLAIEAGFEILGTNKKNEITWLPTTEQLEAFAKAYAQQSSEPVAKPDAWLVPMILDFTDAKKVHFTRSEKGKNLTDDELKSELQGTVIWKAETVYINDSNEPITDKYGVRHYAKPLFTHPPVQSSEPVATLRITEKNTHNFNEHSLTLNSMQTDDPFEYLVLCKRLGIGEHDLFTHPPATVPEECCLVLTFGSIVVNEKLINDEKWMNEQFEKNDSNFQIMLDNTPTGKNAIEFARKYLSASPTPPNTVPLEKYNKLLDAVNWYRDYFSKYIDKHYSVPNWLYVADENFSQAIAEAEGKEG